MGIETVKERSSPPTMRTDQPIGDGLAALLERLMTSRACDGLQLNGEREVVSDVRQGTVQLAGDIAEEGVLGIQPGQEPRIPLPPDIPLDGARDVEAVVTPRTEPRPEAVAYGGVFQPRPGTEAEARLDARPFVAAIRACDSESPPHRDHPPNRREVLRLRSVARLAGQLANSYSCRSRGPMPIQTRPTIRADGSPRSYQAGMNPSHQ